MKRSALRTLETQVHYSTPTKRSSEQGLVTQIEGEARNAERETKPGACNRYTLYGPRGRPAAAASSAAQRHMNCPAGCQRAPGGSRVMACSTARMSGKKGYE